MLTVSHHFLIILQKSQGGHQEKEHCQNPTNLSFSQSKIKLKISHHLQVNTPHSIDFKKFDDKVQYYNLCFEIESGTPAVCKYIAIDTSLHVSLSYDKQHCTATRFLMFENLASYIKQKGEECSIILKELNNIQML